MTQREMLSKKELVSKDATIDLNQSDHTPTLSPQLLQAIRKKKQEGHLDHFIERDGDIFAGTHLIIDVWGASHLDDLNIMEQAFRQAVTEAQATLLHIHLHHFTPNNGISGVAVLAESHISVHTWPECDFAAFDVFMCGNSIPYVLVDIIKAHFKPEQLVISEAQRGKMKLSNPSD